MSDTRDDKTTPRNDKNQDDGKIKLFRTSLYALILRKDEEDTPLIDKV